MKFMGKERPGAFVSAFVLQVFFLIFNMIGAITTNYFAITDEQLLGTSRTTLNLNMFYIVSGLTIPIIILNIVTLIGLKRLKMWGRNAGIAGSVLCLTQVLWMYFFGIQVEYILYQVFNILFLVSLANKNLRTYIQAGQWPVPLTIPGAPTPKPEAPVPTKSSPPVVEASPADEKKYNVKFSSDYDYYQGFVRLKTWIVNMGETVITDCRVKILFDENFMRISQIDPPLPLRHDEVTVGTVNPDEKKTVAFLLDPLMCQTINLDGTLSFRDAKGHLATIQMKPQPIGVTCPIFATPDTINTATALNLAKNVLNHKDSRIYQIPKVIPYEKALIISQGIIQRRNVKHVSDLKIQEKFGVMSIYYGVSKLDNRQYIIRTTVLEETGTLELFVAADDESMLTGELAKLGQDLNEAFCAEAKVCEPIRHVNISIKDSVIMRTNFLFGEEMDGIMSNVEIKDSAIVRSQIGGAGK
jgi:hypothetical protein